MEDVSPAFVGLAAAAAYFVPSMIAFRRGVRFLGVLMTVNTAAGWTGLGWVLVLVWAAAAPAQRRICPACFTGNRVYATLCGACGSHLSLIPRSCPHCGALAHKSATACGECAMPLETAAVRRAS